jgi:squalene-associated FAD-dependent desaturase
VGDKRSVVVVGGGVAGITAALDCADAGASVTLVEVRPRLGGAAYSFARDGAQFDNGQHVFLRCCTAYRELLARLGSEDGTLLQPRLQIPVLCPDGRRTELRRGSLPAPAHLAGTLLRYPLLTLSERLRAARAARALARVDPADPRADEQSFGSWLAAHGQEAAAVERLWDLVALPTLNVRAREASLALASFVFQTGLLGDAAAADIGFHARPLGEVIGEPALRALREADVEVLLGRRARRIEVGAEQLCVPLADGAALEAGAVVLATPHRRAAELLPEALDDVAARLRALGTSPIVNVHVVYDRPVCALDFAAGIGTPVQYLFDRSSAIDLPRGSYLAVSISGADEEMEMSVDELRERYLRALAELFPVAREAQVRRFLVTREHAATFRATPGSGALRPSAGTVIPGLVLAGSFTDTGWPATLEGAARSGHEAARCALRALGIDRVDGVGVPARATGGSAVGAIA